jgi:hypothetical protein
MLQHNDFQDCIFAWRHSNFSPHLGWSDTLPIGVTIGSRLILQKGIYEVVDCISREKAIQLEYISNDEHEDVKICYVCEWIDNIDLVSYNRQYKISNIL